MRLFHLSEQAGIKVFHPRSAPHSSASVDSPVVWAVDEAHLVNYLLPRDCPRVTFTAGPGTSTDDAEKFLGVSGAKRVVAVEDGWLERIRTQHLIRYEFDPAGFELNDAIAGYWISRYSVTPLSEVVLEDSLKELLSCDVELRVMGSLWPLRESVIHSSLEFSIIRMRNARIPEEGHDGYHPLP